MRFQKCHVCGILPSGDFPILSNCCTIQSLNTQMLSQRDPNLKHVHKQHSDILFRNSSDTLFTSPDTIGHKQTPSDTKRHQQTPANAIQCQHEPPRILEQTFGCLGSSVGVCWFLLVSVVVLNCPEITGGGDCEHMGEVYVCLWGLDLF